ncbi:MAG: biotin--[acetyl-CoA-carboxylase] ligase [Burkholderiales bacterium]
MNASCFSTLRILADGELHSVEQLSRATGLSPAGVDGAVRTVEALGLRVSRDPGPGYRLAEPVDLLDPEPLVSKVKQASPEFRLEVLDECPSTNSVLVGRAPAGAAHGTVLVCEHQSAGRGRRGNPWIGSIGGSLAFSILWRFPGGVRALAGLSLAVGVGAAQGLERRGVRAARVKWPNDLYCGESKLGGILIETSGEASGPSTAVIGVGINVRLTATARELIGRSATDVASHSDPVPGRSELLVALLESLAETLARFSDEGFAPFREEWLRRHLWQGRQVALMQAGRRLAEGKVVGVEQDGALMLASEGGVQRFHGGEMSLRIA